MADMFKTAYVCRRYKSHDDWPGRPRDGDVVGQFQIANGAGLRQDVSPGSQLSAHQRAAKTSLRPSSAVSVSSSSDSAAEANVADVGEGLGSISSITESVNSWSFRLPRTSASAAVGVGSVEEKATLLIDDRRRQAHSAVVSADVAQTSPAPHLHSLLPTRVLMVSFCIATLNILNISFSLF